MYNISVLNSALNSFLFLGFSVCFFCFVLVGYLGFRFFSFPGFLFLPPLGQRIS